MAHFVASPEYHIGVDIGEILADPAAQIAALNNLALTHSTHDEFKIALTLTEKALDLCVAWGDQHQEAALHNNLADLLHAVGQSEKAMVHLKQAVTIFAEIGAEAGSEQPEIWKLVEWSKSTGRKNQDKLPTLGMCVFLKHPLG